MSNLTDNSAFPDKNCAFRSNKEKGVQCTKFKKVQIWEHAERLLMSTQNLILKSFLAITVLPHIKRSQIALSPSTEK